MYDFFDYFEKENENQPYENPGEELEDYLRLLDMILEDYLEHKGLGREGKLFSRGLVITESELNAYFEMPPYFRDRDICNPLMAEAANAAFTYIDGRTAATKDVAEVFNQDDLLPVDRIKSVLALNRTELIGMLMALAVEIDRRYERIFGFLQDDIASKKPTLGLLYSLMARITHRDGAEDTLPNILDRKMYTYVYIDGSNRDQLSFPLSLQPLLKNILTRSADIEEIDSDVFRCYVERDGIPLFFEESAQEISYVLAGSNSTEKSGMIYLANEDEETALHLLFKCCEEHSEKLYVLDMSKLLNLPEEKQNLTLSELCLRLKLTDGRLAIRWLGNETKGSSSEENQFDKIRVYLKPLSQVCDPKHIFLYGQKEEPGELAAMLVPSLNIPAPSVAIRTEIWEYFLKSEKGIRLSANVSIPDIADSYEISYGSIRNAVGHAMASLNIRQGNTLNRARILESLRQLNQVDFSGLATYVNPVYTWKDITLTDLQKEILKTACDRYRLRNRIGEGWGLKSRNAYGNGVSLLLYGPPGTGKTMAAQVVANELELPLYRVDLSQISSKYIGETEKNLASIFKAAANANVILFFDEADALFSKRTEVSDSHDKYANNETAFLLQKIEEYNGMSILATNYYNNFDDAFVRRITYAVHMESPDKETRYTLWTRTLPKTAKTVRNIDFRFFADKFELSGSNIKAILFNAAYMAGAEGKPIGPEHIVRAMQYEFSKLGKLVHSSDFGKYSDYLK